MGLSKFQFFELLFFQSYFFRLYFFPNFLQLFTSRHFYCHVYAESLPIVKLDKDKKHTNSIHQLDLLRVGVQLFSMFCLSFIDFYLYAYIQMHFSYSYHDFLFSFDHGVALSPSSPLWYTSSMLLVPKFIEKCQICNSTHLSKKEYGKNNRNSILTTSKSCLFKRFLS